MLLEMEVNEANDQLQKLIQVILHILWCIKNIILTLFYHHCLRMTAQQDGRQYIYDWLNSLFQVVVYDIHCLERFG